VGGRRFSPDKTDRTAESLTIMKTYGVPALTIADEG
jgi:hypothetical protein